MKTRTQDSPAIYRTDRAETGQQLRFDRGTLLLEGVAELPAGLESWFQYDPRVEAYRAPAHRYSEIIGPLKDELARNKAPRYQRRELLCALEMTPYPHQQEALAAWKAAKGRGVIVLPTGAGKTLVGLLALSWAQRDGLIMVPTLDLMQQWYADVYKRQRQDDRLWVILQQSHVLRNGLRGFLSVAGDHDHMNAGVLGGFDRSVGSFAQLIAHPEHAHQGQIRRQRLAVVNRRIRDCYG